MWKRTKIDNSPEAYAARRSERYLTAVTKTLVDIRAWSENQKPAIALVAKGFASKSALQYGDLESATEIYDAMPNEQSWAIEQRAREFFRLTDPMLLQAQRTKLVDESDLKMCFTSALIQVIGKQLSTGTFNSVERDLLAIVGERLAVEALAVKKPSPDQFEQRGADNFVSVALVTEWIGMFRDFLKLPGVEEFTESKRVMHFDSFAMQTPIPRTVQDFLGKTLIEDGILTLDMSGMKKNSYQWLTDGYLALQVGDFTGAQLLFMMAEKSQILSEKRIVERDLAEKLANGEETRAIYLALSMTSDERLTALRRDTPRPYLDNYPADIDQQNEEIFDRALIAEEAGQFDEYFKLIEEIERRQVLPPDFALAFVYQCLLAKKNQRCIDECRKLLDVPNYHFEDARLKALEFMAIAAAREGDVETTFYAIREALLIDISSVTALNTLGGVIKRLYQDEEMSVLLRLRSIAVLRERGMPELADQARAQLEKNYGGDRAILD